MPREMDLAKCVMLGFRELLAEGDTREIGKFLAYTSERIIVPEWLYSICGINTKPSSDDNEGQQEKYDRITDNGLRIQVKFRGGKNKATKRPKLHMEQTRRSTGKNANAGAANGQVRYAINSFDVALFAIPGDDIANLNCWEFMAIPIYELEDTKKPGYCRAGVPVTVQDKYKGRAIEVMKKMEEEMSESKQSQEDSSSNAINDINMVHSINDSL